MKTINKNHSAYVDMLSKYDKSISIDFPIQKLNFSYNLVIKKKYFSMKQLKREIC